MNNSKNSISICSNCRRKFLTGEMIQFDEDLVCTRCEDIYTKKQNGEKIPDSSFKKTLKFMLIGYLLSFAAHLVIFFPFLFTGILTGNNLFYPIATVFIHPMIYVFGGLIRMKLVD